MFSPSSVRQQVEKLLKAREVAGLPIAKAEFGIYNVSDCEVDPAFRPGQFVFVFPCDSGAPSTLFPTVNYKGDLSGYPVPTLHQLTKYGDLFFVIDNESFIDCTGDYFTWENIFEYDDNIFVKDEDGDVSSGMVFYVLPIELSVQDEKATSEPVAPRKTRTLAFL